MFKGLGFLIVRLLFLRVNEILGGCGDGEFEGFFFFWIEGEWDVVKFIGDNSRIR